MKLFKNTLYKHEIHIVNIFLLNMKMLKIIFNLKVLCQILYISLFTLEQIHRNSIPCSSILN